MLSNLFLHSESRGGYGLKSSFGISATVIRASGQTDSETHGKDASNSISQNSFRCFKRA